MAFCIIPQSEYLVKVPPANLIREQWQGSDPVQRLRLVFDNPDDTPLISALAEESWRARSGYSTKVLWKRLLSGYVLGLDTVAALNRPLPLRRKFGASQH